MKSYLWLLLILVVPMLGGCGAINGESDYIPYTEALMTHSNAQSNQIAAQTNGMVRLAEDAIASASTPTEKTLISILTMQGIKELRYTQLQIKAPTTGYDVLNRHIGTMMSTAVTGVLGYFSYDAIKELASFGGNTFEGDVMATDSFNFTESHITSNSGTASIAPALEVVSPEVVDPVIVETGGE